MDKNLTIGVLVGLGALALMPAKANARTMAQPRQTLGFGSLVPGGAGGGLGGGGRLIQLGGGIVPGYGGRVVDPGQPGGSGNGTGFLTPAGVSPYRTNPYSSVTARASGLMGLLSLGSMASKLSMPKFIADAFQGKTVDPTPADLKTYNEWDPSMQPDAGINSGSATINDATLEGLPPDLTVNTPLVDGTVTDAAVNSTVTDAAVTDAAVTDAAVTSTVTDAAVTSVAADTTLGSTVTDAAVTDVAADTTLGSVVTDAAVTDASTLGAWSADGGWLAADSLAADGAGAFVADAALADTAVTVAADVGGASALETFISWLAFL